MPSSPNHLGPHDRLPGVSKAICIFVRTNGQRCKRYVTGPGRTKLCRYHLQLSRGEEPTNRKGEPLQTRQAHADATHHGPQPSQADLLKAAIASDLNKKAKTATALVISEQARRALSALKDPNASNPSVDPRVVLLDSVQSAWRQRQVWEALLASIPEEDFSLLGTPPIPGSPNSSKGARIEAINKMLSEATKVAARTSKLAIDAGIEERLVRLAEDQAAMIADTVRAGIVASMAMLAKSLNLSPAVLAAIQDQALQTASAHLRVLAAGGQEIVEGVAHAVEPLSSPGERAKGQRYRDKKRREALEANREAMEEE